MDEIAKDPRFAHVPKDPKFRRIPKKERKVKIDKRFHSMFKDKNFKVTYTIDKRGRPLQKSSSEDLEKYYDVSSESSDEEESLEAAKIPQKIKKPSKSPKNDENSQIYKKNEENAANSNKISQKYKNGKNAANSNEFSQNSKNAANSKEFSSNSENEENAPNSNEFGANSNSKDEENAANLNDLKIVRKNDPKTINPQIKAKLKDLSIDYARGEGVILSDSSSEEDSSAEDDSEDEGIEHMWGELDKEAETTDEVTSRLAICNLDWDRMRAVDLMVLFNSFLPPGGLIHSITIYPSEFGLERMKEEEVKGPIELTHEDGSTEDAEEERDEEKSGDDEDEEEGNEFRREKLRQYQLNRLKYFYAVMVCDSPATANKIYAECDGHEYESTATKMDLRFIPDGMEFEQEAREICEKLPDLAKYQPRQFTTTALQQVKVECTWDETKLDRQEITKKINSGKIDDIDENDIKAYLASGTSDEESDGENGDKGSGDDEENDRDPLLKYKSLLKSIEDQEEEKKRKEGELEFTWGLGAKEKAEKYVQEKAKKSEKLTPFEEYLQKRKEKKKAKREGKKDAKEEDEEEESGSEESLPADVDMNDPYFAEEFKNPEFKKDKSKKKGKKRLDDESDDEESQRKAELELLLLDKEDEMEKQHFDMKKIEETELLTKSKRKRLLKKKKEQGDVPEDNFAVNVDDPRFNALFTSHHFNIDPADPHYKKTRGTEALVTEKLKRRANKDDVEEITPKIQKSEKSDKMSADLAALIKSVKRNTQNISKTKMPRKK